MAGACAALLAMGLVRALPAGDVSVSVPEEEYSLELAKRIREQLGASAEIGYVNLNQEKRRLSFPLEKPGESAMMRVDLATGLAEIETRPTGVWDAMTYLHRMPGPHNVAILGNWLFMRFWGWVADATGDLAATRELMGQLGLVGEANSTERSPRGDEFRFQVVRPGQTVSAEPLTGGPPPW